MIDNHLKVPEAYKLPYSKLTLIVSSARQFNMSKEIIRNSVYLNIFSSVSTLKIGQNGPRPGVKMTDLVWNINGPLCPCGPLINRS